MGDYKQSEYGGVICPRLPRRRHRDGGQEGPAREGDGVLRRPANGTGKIAGPVERQEYVAGLAAGSGLSDRADEPASRRWFTRRGHAPMSQRRQGWWERGSGLLGVCVLSGVASAHHAGSRARPFRLYFSATPPLPNPQGRFTAADALVGLKQALVGGTTQFPDAASDYVAGVDQRSHGG